MAFRGLLAIGVILGAAWFASTLPPTSPASAQADTKELVDLLHPRVAGAVLGFDPPPGCRDLQTANRVWGLLQAGDKVAATKLSSAEGCHVFPYGALGTIEARSILSDVVCVRRDGEPDCLWFPKGAVESEDVAKARRAEQDVRSAANVDSNRKFNAEWDATPSGQLEKRIGAAFAASRKLNVKELPSGSPSVECAVDNLGGQSPGGVVYRRLSPAETKIEDRVGDGPLVWACHVYK